jgi:hypothetical protein
VMSDILILDTVATANKIYVQSRAYVPLTGPEFLSNDLQYYSVYLVLTC